MSDQTQILVAASGRRWLEFVEEVLRHHEFAVYLCSDSQSAQQTLTQTKIDLIIIDALFMELLKTLAAGSERYRLLVVSVRPDVPEAIDAYRLGALDYVHKAFGEASLVAAVQNVLQKSPANHSIFPSTV